LRPGGLGLLHQLDDAVAGPDQQRPREQPPDRPDPHAVEVDSAHRQPLVADPREAADRHRVLGGRQHVGVVVVVQPDLEDVAGGGAAVAQLVALVRVHAQDGSLQLAGADVQRLHFAGVFVHRPDGQVVVAAGHEARTAPVHAQDGRGLSLDSVCDRGTTDYLTLGNVPYHQRTAIAPAYRE
jgi:hypothetical protein